MRRHFLLDSWAQKCTWGIKGPSYASLNKWVFKLNSAEYVIFLNSADSAFHSRGAAAGKALSPKVLVLVRGCMNEICREERSVRFTSRCSSSSHRYSGALSWAEGTSATVLFSKLSVSLVSNVTAFARQRCVRDDAHMLSALQHYFAHVAVYRAGTVVGPKPWYSALQKSQKSLMTGWFGEWQ